MKLLDQLIFYILVCITTVLGEDSLYDILGINKEAGVKDIKQAYRKKAKDFHPDTNSSPDAGSQFAKISEAYDILSDEDLREIYDREGIEAVKEFQQRGPGFNTQRNVQPVIMVLPITVEQLFQESDIEVSFQRTVPCPKYRQCVITDSSCEGLATRRVVVPHFNIVMVQQDDSCVDKGKAFDRNCSHCSSTTVVEIQTERVHLPKGLKHKQVIELIGKGNIDMMNQKGDLVILIDILPHKYYHRCKYSSDPEFKRMGSDDLCAYLEIDLLDSLIGFTWRLPAADGSDNSIPIKVEGRVTSHGDVLEVKGAGLPRSAEGDARGNVYLFTKVKFPSSINEDDITDLKRILGKSN